MCETTLAPVVPVVIVCKTCGREVAVALTQKDATNAMSLSIRKGGHEGPFTVDSYFTASPEIRSIVESVLDNVRQFPSLLDIPEMRVVNIDTEPTGEELNCLSINERQFTLKLRRPRRCRE